MKTDIPEFGRAIRKARIETGDTLSVMSKGINKSIGFLSAIETGRSKIPLDIVTDIIAFFETRGYTFDCDLYELAIIANGVVNLDGLDENLKSKIVKLTLENNN